MQCNTTCRPAEEQLLKLFVCVCPNSSLDAAVRVGAGFLGAARAPGTSCVNDLFVGLFITLVSSFVYTSQQRLQLSATLSCCRVVRQSASTKMLLFRLITHSDRAVVSSDQATKLGSATVKNKIQPNNREPHVGRIELLPVW